MSTTHLISRLIASVERTADMAPFFECLKTDEGRGMRKLDKVTLGKVLFKNARHTDTVSSPCFVFGWGLPIALSKLAKGGTLFRSCCNVCCIC